MLGAGAAGLFCAATAGARGRSVLVLEANDRPGLKILVSGGGRANFTNRSVDAGHYHSTNPHFAKSALSRYPSSAFVQKVEAHGISYHERDHGQLFCDESAKRITGLLLAECDGAGVRLVTGCPVSVEGVRRLPAVADEGPRAGSAPAPVTDAVESCDGARVGAVDAADDGTVARHAPRFAVTTPRGEVACCSLVVATGGLSWPRLGVTDVGHRIARAFGLGIVLPRPGLVPLQWSGADRARFGALAGIAVPGRVSCRGARFEEAVLFTHGGLSGPAILQISNLWRAGDTVAIDWLPGVDLADDWTAAKAAGERRTVRTLLSERLPRRLVDALLPGAVSVPNRGAPGPAHRDDGRGAPAQRSRPSRPSGRASPGRADSGRSPSSTERPLAQCSGRDLSAWAAAVQAFPFVPAGDAGWSKAEVTLGGVDTADLSSRTLEARAVPGLHFIGEVVDVTGWLGGFNFQWAWASAHAAAHAV